MTSPDHADALRDYIHRTVAHAPPLSPEQRQQVRDLLLASAREHRGERPVTDQQGQGQESQPQRDEVDTDRRIEDGE
jgi:hypothetical protein